MRRNPGHLPAEAVGKRVRVTLVNGWQCGGAGGWAADGKSGCRWARIGDQFDIETYEVVA